MLCNNLDAPDGGIALFAATRASLGKQKAFVSKEKMGAFAPGWFRMFRRSGLPLLCGRLLGRLLP
jgi:hypothetical protein